MTQLSYVFVRPTMVEGIARIFDFGNALSMYHFHPTTQSADDAALRADWTAVGDDLAAALNELADEVANAR